MRKAKKSWAGIDANSINLMGFFFGGALHISRWEVEMKMKGKTQ